MAAPPRGTPVSPRVSAGMGVTSPEISRQIFSKKKEEPFI
jgi:hypothetical protein